MAVWGDTVEYDIVKDFNKLEFAVDGEVHFMTFKDVLSVLSLGHGFENKPGHIRLASYNLLLELLKQLAILVFAISQFK